ncbi:MAG: polysaccharide deacetylase family protein [Thermoplasmatota archaeon]
MEIEIDFDEDSQFKNKINYVFNFILSNLEFKKDALSITYGNEVNKKDDLQIHLYRTDQIFSPNNYLYNKPNLDVDKRLNIKEIDELDEDNFTKKTLPVLFKGVKNGEVLKINNRYIELNIDIITSIFFMLTRYEEYIADQDQLDNHDRFPTKKSIAYKEGFLDRPIVDEYVELLRQLINCLGIDCKWRNPWKDANFTACLTHDVDSVKRFNSIRQVGQRIIKDMSLIVTYRAIKRYFESRMDYKKDPVWTFDYIMETENKYDFNSSFYFMATHNKDDYGSDYNLSSHKIKKLLKKIEKNNNEIGIHPGYNTFNDAGKFKKQVDKLKNILNNKIFGGRQHYLKFDIKETLDLYEKNNLLYDSTLYFAHQAGFRCGTSHPFKVYSLTQDRELDLWEIPLIVMDRTLKSEKYMNLEPEKALAYTRKLIDKIKKYNGVFTLLWHNSNFTDKWEDWKYVYEEILKYIYKEDGKGMSGKEIIEALEEN